MHTEAEEARKEKSYQGLNLLSRYHAEAHQKDLGKEHLPKKRMIL